MLPFEFTVKGPPVSAQTKNRSRLRSWKGEVRRAAKRELGSSTATPTSKNVSVEITYYHESDPPDVDNIIKPIQDALIGVIYVDDSQVVDTRSRREDLNGSYTIKGASKLILAGFGDEDEFLHIKISEARPTIGLPR